MTPEQIRIACAEEMGTFACPGCAWEKLECPVHDHRVPDYPTDANAALLLVEHLTRGKWFCKMMGERDLWAVTFETGMEAFCPRHTHAANSLPLAICGAFLKATGRWIEPKPSEPTPP
jgi:hypothetical protein